MKHYFVDETGDPILFDRKGHVVAGTPGRSRYFALGFLDVADPESLRADLDRLREGLLANPYFGSVPSMQAEQRKTALFFHAKDDVPEVRWRVFEALARHDVQFHAVVRDKAAFAHWVRETNRRSLEYRYHPNKLYDTMVRTLFRDYLHKEDAYAICFALRGARDRSMALREALEDARKSFRRKWSIQGHGAIEVRVFSPEQSAGLQAADYFLWALQRCYERREDRYVRFLWSRIRRVHDLDDRRDNPYGVYYSSRRPLLAERLPPLAQKKGWER